MAASCMQQDLAVPQQEPGHAGSTLPRQAPRTQRIACCNRTLHVHRSCIGDQGTGSAFTFYKRVLQGEGGLPPGAVQIELTPEENEAVGRLEGLGFPRAACLQVRRPDAPSVSMNATPPCAAERRKMHSVTCQLECLGGAVRAWSMRGCIVMRGVQVTWGASVLVQHPESMQRLVWHCASGTIM